MQIEYSRISHHAPRRCSVELPGGLYYSRSWTVADVQQYRAIGGWFSRGEHDFADKEAATVAYE